ncbi:MAG: ATP synthase subunit I [Lachnospiraceae bacterium]|nr:ATP synthase subunit I [Lachnospiraceae bacterium]
MKLLEKMQPALKQESKKIILITLVGNVFMWLVWGLLGMAFPEKVVFDITVLLGGLVGGAVAVWNFVWMGLSLQKAVNVEDPELAKKLIQANYGKRNLLRIVWVAVAIMVPCFHYVAGLIPLVFPGTGLKLMGVFAAFAKKDKREVM